MRLFSRTVAKNDHFALDIGSSSVKVLQLAKSGPHFIVVAAGHSPINRSVVADKTIVDIEALAVAIEKAIKNAGIKSKSAIAAMPASQAAIRTITLPNDLNELEQENMMYLEAPNYIPFPMEEVRMDFDILGGNISDPTKWDVQLVATKLEHFQSRVDAILAANLVCDVMDVDELAIERAMRFVIHQDPLPSHLTETIEVLVDIGHEFTTVHVFKDGKSIYTREQNFGMKQLTDEVGRRFGLSSQEAQVAMSQASYAQSSYSPAQPEAEEALTEERKNSVLGEEYTTEILPQFRNEVANQINRLIQFFFAATSYNRVHRIWVCGGGGSLADVVQNIHDVTGVRTQIVNPLLLVGDSGGSSKVSASYLQTMGPSFLTAFGLAIRED